MVTLNTICTWSAENNEGYHIVLFQASWVHFYLRVIYYYYLRFLTKV